MDPAYIIGALDNDYGTVGVAPGVRIWSIAGTEYMWDIYAGFEYIVEHANEIEIVNCSMGNLSYGQTYSRSPYQEAIRKCVAKGLIVVCGAGNNHEDIAGPDGILDDGYTTDNFLPAGFPESMAVSAVNPSFDRFASYSNFSATNHSQRFVISPGAAIDVAGPTEVLAPILSSSYGFFSGTSCATPHVSGLVALYIAKHGRATDAAGVYRIRQAIVDAAQPQSSWQAVETCDPDPNPEGLAVASPAWLDPAPKISRIEKLPNRVEVVACTLSGYLHSLEESPSLGLTEAWNSGEAVPGTGGELTFVHNPAGSRNFYRLATRAIPWNVVDPIAETNLGSAGVSANGWLHLTKRSAGDMLVVEPSGRSLLHLGLAELGGVGGMIVPWKSELAPASSFSVEIWLKPARNTAENTTFSNYAPSLISATETDWHVWRGWSLTQYLRGNPPNPNGFSFILCTGGTNFVVPSVQMALDTSKWYHVVGVYDGASVLLYVDGSLAQSVAIPSGRVYLPPLNTGICLGSDYGTRWFEGRLDEAAFYPHALSAAQVLAHYQAGINPTPPIPYPQVILSDNPAGYWRFNEP